MKASVGTKGEITIPKAIRKRKRIRPGDNIEIFEDEDEIIIRKVEEQPNAGLVKHLLACPYKGWFKRPRRRREPMRKARL